MNAVSANFEVLGNEAILGSAASVAAISRATGLKVRTADAQGARHAEAMLAVLDRTQPGTGEALAAQLRERYPATPVVVLVLPEQHDGAKDASLRAVDFVQGLSRSPAAADRSTLAFAAKGPDAAEKATPSSLGLTLRQLDVLGLIAQGKPNKLICRELRLAEGTVKCHVSAILRALNVGSRTQAALKAARIGLAPHGAA